MRLPRGGGEGLPGLQAVAAHHILVPVWPIAHQLSCFGSCAESGATATAASVPAMGEGFGKGIQLPWLLRSNHHNLDGYLDKLHFWEKGEKPSWRVESSIQRAQYTCSWMSLFMSSYAFPTGKITSDFPVPSVSISSLSSFALKLSGEQVANIRGEKSMRQNLSPLFLRMRLKII